MNQTHTLRTLVAALLTAGAFALPAQAQQTPPAAAPGTGPGMGNPAQMQQRMQAHMAAGAPGGMHPDMQRGAHAGHGHGHDGMHGGHGHDGMHGRKGMRMLDSVDATPEQKGQIVRITETLKAEMKPHRVAGMALRDKMQGLMAQPTIDTAAVEALRVQLVAHHEQASKRRMQTMLDVAKVLTPEQRAKLAAMRKAGDEPMQHGQRRMIIEPIERSGAPAPR